MTKAFDHTPLTFPIVGIGASAGGLEAFQQFFRACPVDIGMAFILVSHLEPNHVSLLTEILQRTTAMPVIEAIDLVEVKPNCVYIIPPNRDMKIIHGKLQLSLPEQPPKHRMPIDTFLVSLADDQQDNAIGIIFSGTGSDGTLGLRAIYGAGGTTLVQEPTSSQYDGMPTSAIQAGNVSQVLSVDKMPAALLHHSHANQAHVKNVSPKPSASGINHILTQLRRITGNDFSLYKKSTIGRRIERRMSQHQITDTDIYARYIKTHPEEAHILFKEMLINVTSFFRDAEAFAVLQKEILPRLCKDKPDDYNFRVWIAGCSTGEEAYSIAILLHELLDETRQSFTVQIFSTDLDDDAIATARAGIYSAKSCQDITPERLQRFFTKVDAGYQVNKSIRDMIVFAVQNIVKDPPFTKLDLLTCRNLMIYLEPDLQSRLMFTFHYALKPEGILFLSPSESIGSHEELFVPLDRKWKFYTIKNSVSLSRFANTNLINVTASHKQKPSVKAEMKQPNSINLTDFSRRVLSQCFAPASVITDLAGNILYVHGETGKYLHPAPGQSSFNVIEMAREGLEMELCAAIYAAANEEKSTLNREMQVKTNGEYTTVSLSVRPLPNSPLEKQTMLLVSFIDVAGEIAKPKRKRTTKTAELGHIDKLERDLMYLKENHQVIIGEHQAANEELKSMNEELQSTNEEMQSTNEELETSQEELQSVNEELITVNTELQTKIEMLDTMQNDMKNLLDSIDIGIVFLDKHLNIRSFTHEATHFYRLVPSDVGRPLSYIKPVTDVVCDNLIEASQNVLATLIPNEREFQVGHSLWVMVRIQPYRTIDNFIDGVVLTFTDITARIQTTKDALQLANSIVNTVREPLIVLDSTLKVIAASHSFYAQFKVKPEDTIGNMIFELGNHQWNILALRTLLEEVLSKNLDFDDYDVEHTFPTIGHRKMRLNARRINSETSQPALILLSIEVNV